MWFPARVPSFIRWWFKNYHWQLPTDKKVIYLTFDDGPHQELTPWVLQTLKHYSAKATFFCIGENVSKYPSHFKQIISEGHTIGNHTYNHLKGWKTSTKDYLKNTATAEAEFNKYLPQTRKKWFRPPHGQITSSQAKALQSQGYSIVMWSLITKDWDNNISQEQCLKNSKKTKSGDIIVFHDSEKAKSHLQYVLPKFLEYYSKQGFVFKGLD